MDTLDDVDADDDVDAELDVDALKKKIVMIQNYVVYLYSFSKQPRDVAICFPVRILCTLEYIGCKNAYTFSKS